MRMEADLASSRKGGCIAMALDKVVSAKRKAFFQWSIYFLTKREIPNKTNFTPLLELEKSLGAMYLQDRHLSSNAQYMSDLFVQEVVLALGETIAAPIISSVGQSPFFAVCIDETTDVSVKKELIIYITYICTWEIKTKIFRIFELPDGTSHTSTEAVRTLSREMGFHM